MISYIVRHTNFARDRIGSLGVLGDKTRAIMWHKLGEELNVLGQHKTLEQWKNVIEFCFVINKNCAISCLLIFLVLEEFKIRRKIRNDKIFQRLKENWGKYDKAEISNDRPTADKRAFWEFRFRTHFWAINWIQNN